LALASLLFAEARARAITYRL